MSIRTITGAAVGVATLIGAPATALRELRQRSCDCAAATDGGPLMYSRRALTLLMTLAALLAAAIPSTAGAEKPSKSPAQELVTFAAAGCAADDKRGARAAEHRGLERAFRQP